MAQRFVISLGSELCLNEPGKTEYYISLYELDADGDPMGLPLAGAQGKVWTSEISDGEPILHKTAVFLRAVCRDVEDQFLDAVRHGRIGVPANISRDTGI